MGTGIMDDLKHAGTLDSNRERLNMFVKTSVSWSAHFFRMRPTTSSGPTAFLGLVFQRQTPDVMVALDRG